MADDLQYVKLPDGSYGAFPASMKDEDIAGAVQKHFPSPRTPVDTTASRTDASGKPIKESNAPQGDLQTGQGMAARSVQQSREETASPVIDAANKHIDNQVKLGAAENRASRSPTPVTNASMLFAPTQGARMLIGSKLGSGLGEKIEPTYGGLVGGILGGLGASYTPGAATSSAQRVLRGPGGAGDVMVNPLSAVTRELEARIPRNGLTPIKADPFEGSTSTLKPIGNDPLPPVGSVRLPQVAAPTPARPGPFNGATSSLRPVGSAELPPPTNARLPQIAPPAAAAAAPTPQAPSNGALQPIGKGTYPRGFGNLGKGEPLKLNDVVDQAMGVKPLIPKVPLREQPTSRPIEPLEVTDPIKAKYPDPQVRQMVRANGERIYEAAKGDPNTVKALHDLTRVDLRQVAINADIDMGQKTVSNSKFAGEGSIPREEMFNQLLDKGLTPQKILELAKQTPSELSGGFAKAAPADIAPTAKATTRKNTPRAPKRLTNISTSFPRLTIRLARP